MASNLHICSSGSPTELSLPIAEESVHAGFPSPAQDYPAETIDLNKELIRHPSTTFYARVVGDSMRDAAIDEGDLLVIDKALEPRDGDIVVAFVDGEFTLKTIRMGADKHSLILMPANNRYPAITIDETNEFMIWGVVTYTIKYRRKP